MPLGQNRTENEVGLTAMNALDTRHRRRSKTRFGAGAGLLALFWLTAAGCSCSRSPSEGAAGGPKESSGTSGAQAPAQAGEVARPKGTALAAFSVGQWSKYRVDSDDGSSTEVTYKIVAEEQGAYWLEIVRGVANAGTVMQLLISVKDLTAAKIRMPNGHVRELRDEMLQPTAAGYRKALSDIFVPALDGATQEDVTVPAGKFSGAYKRLQKVDTSKGSSEQNVWIHPSVPISGVVKSEEVGKPNKTVLIAFGQDGAKSEMTKEAKPVE
jgi:hypothetical protein